MKLYLHRNGVTCQRLQCRTHISFVFNLNEKFCWGRLFSAYSWFIYICVCTCMCLHMCAYTLHSLLLSCFSVSVLVCILRRLHFKLDDRLQHDKSCKWYNDGIPICWNLSCFSLTPLFSSIFWGSRYIMMFTDKHQLCADDIVQYSVSFTYNYSSLFKNYRDFTTGRDKEFGHCFFCSVCHVGSWLLTET